MTRPPLRGERAIALFLFAFLAFNPPILTIFSKDTVIFGLPLLYFYLFSAWGLVILLLGLHATGALRALVARRDRQGGAQAGPHLAGPSQSGPFKSGGDGD